MLVFWQKAPGDLASPTAVATAVRFFRAYLWSYVSPQMVHIWSIFKHNTTEMREYWSNLPKYVIFSSLIEQNSACWLEGRPLSCAITRTEIVTKKPSKDPLRGKDRHWGRALYQFEPDFDLAWGPQSPRKGLFKHQLLEEKAIIFVEMAKKRHI